MKTTVRNLRIREDRAKYLYNLDPNSAYYDPKTRAMRDNPLPDDNPEDLVFAGDNFIRLVRDSTWRDEAWHQWHPTGWFLAHFARSKSIDYRRGRRRRRRHR